MKKYLNILSLFFVVLLFFACARQDYWNNSSELSDGAKGTIVGQLINEETDLPLKGIKILFERQTSANGAQTFIDTVSTDENGNFSYKIPFPNKVKVSIHDMNRYNQDIHEVLVLENKEYRIDMKSFPKFGETTLIAKVQNISNKVLSGINVALYVKDSPNESYSLFENLVTNDEGEVIFKNVAFPVYYKIAVNEMPQLYDLDSIENHLTAKNPASVTLTIREKFSSGDIDVVASYFYVPYKTPINENVSYQYKSILSDEFTELKRIALDANGKFELKDIVYPGVLKIVPNENSTHPFIPIEVIVEESHALAQLDIELRDATPRYPNPIFTNLKVETSVPFAAAFSELAPQGVAGDDEGNIFIADGSRHQILKMDRFGNVSVVAGKLKTAGSLDGPVSSATLNGPWDVTVDDKGNIYTVDNANSTGSHKIRKISLNPNTNQYEVSTLAGTGTAGGTNGAFASATFNRPGSIIFDKQRNCLYVGEWSGHRLRKLDLNTNTVSTLAGSGSAGAPTNGLGTSAVVNSARGLSLSPDNKYIFTVSHTQGALTRIDVTTGEQVVVRTGLGGNRGLFSYPNSNGTYGVVVTRETSGATGTNTIWNLSSIPANGVFPTTPTVIAGGAGAEIKDGIGTAARFNRPFAIHYNAWTGTWYVCDAADGNLAGGAVRTIRSLDLD